MRLPVILRYSGIVLLLNSGFMLLASLVSAGYRDPAFFLLLYCFLVTALFGVFPIIFIPPARDITNKEGFLILVASWLLSCLSGSLPYILWGGEFSLTNAWFESVSGFTTTGSSILNDIEGLPRGLLFWRSATHWIGGIGIIIFVLAVLPAMGRAGLVLYRAEISALAKENFHYRTQKTVKILFYVYLGLTLGETLALMLCGMHWFDAVTNAFGTIATGGFSPRNLSIASYHSLAVEIVVMVFMVLAGMHFGLLFACLQGDFSGLLRSSYVRYYLGALGVGVLLCMASVHGAVYAQWGSALRYAAFQVLSIGTSSGFATADSSVWPALTQLVILFFTFQCACSGSTSGGIKVDRVVIFWQSIRRRIDLMKHPHGVFAPKVDGVAIDADILEAGAQYIVLYVLIVLVSSLFLTAFGVDGLAAFSGAAAAMGNVGPGLGGVGSLANYSAVPDPGKWVLTATMLLGRLEIFGLIVFFMGRAWK